LVLKKIKPLKLELLYKKKVNEILSSDFKYYICINPIGELKSFEHFRFLIKKCFRDISKFYRIKQSKEYLKYVSVIEVDKSITKGQTDIKGLGLHTHIFLDRKSGTTIFCPSVFRKIIRDVFRKENIEIDYYEQSEILTPERFVNYHTKQFGYLDENFLVSNIKEVPLN
jgi:hypothetical protein